MTAQQGTPDQSTRETPLNVVAQQAQSPPPPGGVVYITSSPTMSEPIILENYAYLSIMWLASSQVTLGILCILFKIGTIISGSGVGLVATGIWTGICFIIAGAFGIVSAKHRTMGLVITYMVMSVVAILFAASLIGLSAAALGLETAEHRHKEEGYLTLQEHVAGLLLHAFLLVFGIIQMVTFIVSAALCCRAACCGGLSTQSQAQPPVPVQFLTSQQQQVPASGASVATSSTSPVVAASPAVVSMVTETGMETSNPVGDDLPPSYSETPLDSESGPNQVSVDDRKQLIQ